MTLMYRNLAQTSFIGTTVLLVSSRNHVHWTHQPSWQHLTRHQ
jgi:hypothetical protein